jgi:hypothetical protein
LIFGEHRDEEPECKNHNHEESGTDGQGEIRAAKWNMEPVDGKERTDGHVEHAQNEIGRQLAQHDFHCGDGR